MDRKLKLLNNYLEDAISYRDAYPSEKDDIKKEKIIKNFLNEVISFLDYSLTGFPNHEKLLKDCTFPRESLINRLEEFKNKFIADKYPAKVISYLAFCYKTNKKYNNALFYVIGGHKHRDVVKKLEKGSKAQITGEINIDSDYNPIKQNHDGSMDIAGLISVPSDIKNFSMHGITLVNGNTTVGIDHLYADSIIIEGKNVRLKGQSFDFSLWSSEVISILKEIYSYYEAIVCN